MDGRQQSAPFRVDHAEDEFIDMNRGAKAKMKSAVMSVFIIAVLACVGGGVAYLILRSDAGPAATTPLPPADIPDTEGGPFCKTGSDGVCTECLEGFQLFGSTRCFYKCSSGLSFQVREPSKKGLTVDDTTLHFCAGQMPFHWPNTEEPVKTLRMFKAWQANWNEDYLNKTLVWEHIASYLRTSDAKVLVGTQVTCNSTDDDLDWENVKKMITIFGAEHIMGVAVGNEMELLWQKDYLTDPKDIWFECMDLVWTKRYYLDTFHNRIKDLDLLGAAFARVPVTSVFGGAVFASPFVEAPVVNNGQYQRAALALTFLRNVTADNLTKSRWVWTLNIYPYFDPNLPLDADGSHCKKAIADTTCFGHEGCLFIDLVVGMRRRMGQLGTGARSDDKLWIGETGWSSPKAGPLNSAVADCEEFSTDENLATYYDHFLSWDMEVKGDRGPDHVFYFTMRDSGNFGSEEHFGLVGGPQSTNKQWCNMTTCKLQQSGPSPSPSPGPSPGPAPITPTTPSPSPSPSPGPSPSPSPSPVLVIKCCLDASMLPECADYPGDGRFCNNKWDKRCQSDQDCQATTTTTKSRGDIEV